MGFASYLEDIVERLRKDLQTLQPLGTERNSANYKNCEQAQHAIQKTLERVISELKELRKLTTDPKIDMAHELMETKKRCAELEARIQQIRAAHSNYVSRTNDEISRLHKKLKHTTAAFRDYVSRFENRRSFLQVLRSNRTSNPRKKR